MVYCWSKGIKDVDGVVLEGKIVPLLCPLTNPSVYSFNLFSNSCSPPPFDMVLSEKIEINVVFSRAVWWLFVKWY